MDALFDRTKYGKEIEILAGKLADEFIRNLGKTDEVDKAVKQMSSKSLHMSVNCIFIWF